MAKLIKPLHLGYSACVVEQDNKFHFVASASMYIDLATGSTRLELDAADAIYTAMGDQPLPDMGMPKPNGEFIVSGSFYAPGGQAVAASEIKVSLGSQSKRLYVFGPRQWNMGIPSDPEPMAELEISYANAFGGRNYPSNPNGTGYDDGLLPRIENPDRLVTSRDTRAEPAGFACLDPGWPQRTRFQGTYDEQYLRRYFPGYPADHDWRTFLCTPEDQWIDGYYRGDEAYEIRHMHPDHPVLQGSLPGFYARCFVLQNTGSADPQFSELPLNLDTVWFFPGEQMAMLIWRGGVPVADDEASQVEQVLLAYESRADQQRSEDYYRRAMDRRIASGDPLLSSLNTRDLIAERHKSAMQILQERALDEVPDSEFVKNLDAKVDALQQLADEKISEVGSQVNEQLATIDMPADQRPDIEALLKPATGTNPDVAALNRKLEEILPGVTSGDAKKLDLSEFSFDKLDQLIDTAGGFIEDKERQAAAVVQTELEKVKEQLLKQLSFADDLPDEGRESMQASLRQIEELAVDEKPKAVMPRLKAEELLSTLSELSPRLMQGIQQLQSMKIGGADEAELEKVERQLHETLEQQQEEARAQLLQAEKDFKEVYSMAAHGMEVCSSPHKDESLDSVRERFVDAIRTRTVVSNGDWACVDLSGLNLDGIDLSGAYLEQVNFSGASLKGANLGGAIMVRAILVDCDLTGARLEGANIGGVQADNCNFTDAVLKNTQLFRARLTGAQFRRAQLEDCDALEIRIDDADFSQATLTRIQFVQTSVQGARFAEAQIIGSAFLDLRLQDCDFARATMPGTIFADVGFESTDFSGADLSGSCFLASDPDKSGMTKVRFAGSKLSKCNFQGMSMPATDISGANLEGACFVEANLTGADLSKCVAKGANLRKARLTNAKMDGVDLMEGIMSKTHLVGTSLVGANLYAVDFLRSTVGETNFLDSNTDATLIQDWRP